VRQLSAVYQAKKFREVGIEENLGQGNVVSGATLNDRANDGRRFINPVVHQRDGNWSRARRDQPIDRFDEFLVLAMSIVCGAGSKPPWPPARPCAVEPSI
jgi:hypothetical protein